MRKRTDTTVDDFIKVIQYKIISSIRNHWGSLDKFKADWDYYKKNKNSESNRIFSRIVSNFHIEHTTLVNIAGRDSSGAKQLGGFLKSLDKTNPTLVYVHKTDIKYQKSGKKFSAKSWFYIPFPTLEDLFSKIGQFGVDPFRVDSTSNHYTKRQHELIDKWIFGYSGKKDPETGELVARTYTKGDKFYQYQMIRRNKRLEQVKKREQQELIDLSSSEDFSEEDIQRLLEGIVLD